MTTYKLIIEIILPILSIGLAILSIFLSYKFYLSGKKSADHAQRVLDDIERRGREWQTDIIKSATGILDSSPSVIGSKLYLAKLDAAKKITEMINDLSKQFMSEPEKKEAIELLMKYHYYYLNLFLGGNSPTLLETLKQGHIGEK